jgi:hypothetical protein
MEGTEQTLLVILAGALALFLLLGIIALIKLIQVLNHLKRISEKAEKIADKAENITDFFRYSAGPAAFAKLLAGISEVVFKRGNNKSRRGRDDD